MKKLLVLLGLVAAGVAIYLNTAPRLPGPTESGSPDEPDHSPPAAPTTPVEPGDPE